MKKKVRILIVLLSITLVLPFGITFSKYVYDFVSDYVLGAKNFYFNSDKLTGSGTSYSINNWGGASEFTIQFQLNNHKNNLLTSDSDIEYEIELSCIGDVTCTINADSGIIYTEEMTDNFSISVTPNRIFDTDESVTVNVSASSISPYTKTISASFTITVGRKGINFEIVDDVNRAYLNFTITNSRESYKVKTAFDGYSVDDEITTEEYISLTDEQKANCYCALVTLSFDANDIVIDTTSDVLGYATITSQNIDGVNYINSLTFNVDTMSSTTIRFYKKDVANDYTYPYVTTTPIISFSAL